MSSFFKSFSLPQFLSLLVLFFLPSQLGKHFWPSFTTVEHLRLDYISPTLYFTDLLLLSLIFVQSSKLILCLKHLKIFQLVFFSLAISACVWFLISPAISLLYFFLRVTLIVCGLYLTFTNLQTSLMKQMAASLLCLGLLLQTGLCLYQWHTGHSSNSFFYFLGERTFSVNQPLIAKGIFHGQLTLRPYGTFSHPNSLAAYAVLATLIICHLTAKKSFRLLSFLSTFVICFLTQSSNVYFALFASCILLLVYFRTHNLNKLVALSFLFTLCVPFLLVLIAPLNHPSLSQRLPAYQAIPQFLVTFPLGTGPGQFLNHAAKLLPATLANLQPIHNTFWLAIIQLGLPLSLFLVKKFFSKLPHQAPAFLIFGLLFIIYTSAFDHYWLTLPQNQLLLCFFIFFLPLQTAKI